MNQLLNEILSTILQIILFTSIPFIFFLFRIDKSVAFSRYIGFYRPTARSVWYSLAVSLFFLIATIGLAFVDGDIKQLLFSPHTVTGRLRSMGLDGTSVAMLLIVALFKTSLAEEILFRGFIAKRLISRFGFKIGNLIQAVIFGAVHLLLFSLLVQTEIYAIAFIFVFSSLAGGLIGYIKEKHANGSIIPGWVAHGLGNTISYFIIAFVL